MGVAASALVVMAGHLALWGGFSRQRMVTPLRVTPVALVGFIMSQRHKRLGAAVEVLPHLAQVETVGQIARALLPVVLGWPPLKGTVVAVVAGLKVLRQVVTVAQVSRVFA